MLSSNQSVTTWIERTRREAPEGEVVMTRSPGGQVQPLVRSGNLWFFPDRSMYVYYTPEAWAPVSERSDSGTA